MAGPSVTPPAVLGGAHLTVSWSGPGSKTWHQFEDGVARAILAANLSRQATFFLDETVRRSPRLTAQTRKRKRAGADARPYKHSKTSERGTLLVTLTSAQDGRTASDASRAVRWGFSSTCTFDRLPNRPRALLAMIADCEATKKRQVFSHLLDHMITEERVEDFLFKVRSSISDQLPRTNARISRFTANARARPGTALYERFLDTMVKHARALGGALRSRMGSPSQDFTPLAFAFHGTPPVNLPSILTDGMLKEKRVRGGDWFATSPWTSVRYCQKHSHTEQSPVQLIVFLLLPVKRAVRYSLGDVITMYDERYELPLGIIDLHYDIVRIPGAHHRRD